MGNTENRERAQRQMQKTERNEKEDKCDAPRCKVDKKLYATFEKASEEVIDYLEMFNKMQQIEQAILLGQSETPV